MVATLVLESCGGQTYELDPDTVLKRLDEAYGPGAASAAEPITNQIRDLNNAHHILGYN
jgi:hypothetical protein